MTDDVRTIGMNGDGTGVPPAAGYVGVRVHFLSPNVYALQQVHDHIGGGIEAYTVFTAGEVPNVYLCLEAPDIEGRLAHELGHLKGLDHPATDTWVGYLTWVVWSIVHGFNTMSCQPRIRDPEGLRPYARVLLKVWGHA